MLKVKIIAVGTLKEQYFRDAVDEYLKRMQRFCDVSVIEVPESCVKSGSKADLMLAKNTEGKKLLEKASGFKIALDVRGVSMSSEEFAWLIGGRAALGVSNISFLIGGSNGLSEEVLRSADCGISFSQLTFPHQLMRVIFAEQLYRSFTITGGMPYHK